MLNSYRIQLDMSANFSIRQSSLFEAFPIRFWHVTGYVLICLLVTPLQASQKYQSKASIRETAYEYMLEIAKREHRAVVQIQVSRLDTRLRLAACEEGLEAFLPQGSRTLGNSTVGVRCNGVKPWTLYVPVQVAVFREVLITTRPLARGEILSAADLRLERRNLETLRAGYLTNPNQAIGRVAKRSLTAGTALSAATLTAPRVIKRGEKVTLLMDIPGIQVRATAKALGDGALGETISVRNTSSRQVVQATVVSPGIVRVNR